MNKEIEANTYLSHYRILSKIGAGGMGQVYLAEDTKLDRRIALKLLNDEFARNSDKLTRFVQEAKAASALNHPNILTVYEIGEADGKNYIATEWIEGKTLRETLREHPSPKEPLPLRTVFRIAIQVAEALAAAHDAGIIHRDVKPENIMIRKDGYAKVVDFGLAKLSDIPPPASEITGDEATVAQIYTAPGIVLGTVAYMSPEQARGHDVDTRTDIFSLGIILYEMLAFRRPFNGITSSHEIVAILEKTPLPIAASGVHVPVDLETIVIRMLEKNADNRYQTAGEVADDLKSLRRRLEFEEQLELTISPDGDTATRIYYAPAKDVETANTIAVLPFVNMSRGSDGDYFSDGLAEELINVLSKIRGFRVAARTSAFSFKGKQTTIAEIGHALNVASVLEGSIRIAGNRVRSSVKLLKVSDGYHLWSETYDRKMDDIFAVQDDIAQSVVAELRARLLGKTSGSDISPQVVNEVAEAVKGRAANPEAQRLMLLGRHFLDRTTREDTTTAITYFRQALELDPGYALCWAELGRAYSIEASRAWVPLSEGFDRSRDATKRSLVLEPALAEGHAQLGRVQLTHDLDLREAEASYKRALKLAPGSSSVMDGAGVLAYKLGRLDEALELGHRVLVQDPLSAAFWHNLGLTAHAAGRLAESENAFRRAIELVPQRFVSHALLALVLVDQGRVEEAFEEAALEPYEVWRIWSLAIIHHAAGRKDKSDEALGLLTANHADGNAYQLAEVYSMREEIDLAFEWLERAFAERDPGVTHAKVNPRFRPLHDDPRWMDLLTKIGFDQ